MEIVRASADRPSSFSGVHPPMGALRSMFECDSRDPITTSSCTKIAPPRKSASPTNVVPSSTSGTFPLVSTVPDASGSVSNRSPVASVTPRRRRSRPPCAPPVKARGKALARAPRKRRGAGASASPIVRAPLNVTSPWIAVSPTISTLSITSGSEPDVTTVPDWSGSERNESAVGSGTWNAVLKPEAPASVKTSGNRPCNAELTSSVDAPTGDPSTLDPPISTSPVTPRLPKAPASAVMSRRFPVVRRTPEASGMTISWDWTTRYAGSQRIIAHFSTVAPTA
mmetsp:Transcript_46884/g.110556  ORF Transcript_46884/g.110556 Transcript_46884/m.110556 type:complete len:282 (-) Transcript_46884:311-1156(-)